MKSRLYYLRQIEEVLDNALNDLKPEDYDKLLVDVIKECEDILED